MYETIQSIAEIPIPFNMIILVVLIGSIASVLGTLAWQISAFACHCQEVAFKRELVDRGMSADEIERIVQVRAPQNDKVEKQQ